MSDAIITRRGGAGGAIENSKKMKVFPAENIAKNMFVEKTTAKTLLKFTNNVSQLATFDGENFLYASGKNIGFITKNEQGEYEQSDYIDLGTTNEINNIYLLSNQLAIIGDLGRQQDSDHYWYIVRIDFESKLAAKTYTSSAYGGGNYSVNGQDYGLKVQVINSNTFLLMFTFSDNVYGYQTCCEFTLYTVNSSGVPTVKKQWVKKVEKLGFLKASILGKFDEGEDSNGKYGLYWAQISYSNDEYNKITASSPSVLKNWVHLSIKVYYDTGNYEELYSNIGLTSTAPSSVPPGLYNSLKTRVIKNTLVDLQSSYAGIIKFNSNHIPNSNTPTNLQFTSGDKESGYGSKYTIDDGTNSLFLDALYFNCMQRISQENHYLTGRIVPTNDFVVFECLKYYGKSTEFENYGLLGKIKWSFYGNAQNHIAVNSFSSYLLALPLEYFAVKLSSNSIFGVTNIKKLNDLEVDEISALSN